MKSSMAIGACMVQCGKSSLKNALSLVLEHRHAVHTHTITMPYHHHHFILLLNLAFPFDFLAVPFFQKPFCQTLAVVEWKEKKRGRYIEKESARWILLAFLSFSNDHACQMEWIKRRNYFEKPLCEQHIWTNTRAYLYDRLHTQAIFIFPTISNVSRACSVWQFV